MYERIDSKNILRLLYVISFTFKEIQQQSMNNELSIAVCICKAWPSVCRSHSFFQNPPLAFRGIPNSEHDQGCCSWTDLISSSHYIHHVNILRGLPMCSSSRGRLRVTYKKQCQNQMYLSRFVVFIDANQMKQFSWALQKHFHIAAHIHILIHGDNYWQLNRSFSLSW